MKTYILSKPQFNYQMSKLDITDSNVENNTDTFYISINDTAGEYSTSHFSSDHNNVLRLFFDDVSEDGSVRILGEIDANYIVKAFTEDQAKEILSFLKNQTDKKECYVHCSAGISRSGAVGTFVSDYFGCDYFEFKKTNPQIQPNGLVLQLLNRTYRFQDIVYSPELDKYSGQVLFPELLAKANEMLKNSNIQDIINKSKPNADNNS